MLFTDQMNRQVTLLQPPTRIVSLVPSQTELLFYLGAGEKVVGVTKFCVHPQEKVKGVPKIGGTKNFKLDLINQLQPDLIIGNKEENYQEGIEQLQQKYPVWMSDIYTLEDTLEMIKGIGEITQTSKKAAALTQTLQRNFSALQPASPPIPTAYLIWRDPYMVAGENTFIHQLLTLAGFHNVFGSSTRYPEVSAIALQAAAPEVILLSSEPYPFKEKHVAEFREICPKARVLLVDGELFSWYGSRLLQTVPYLKRILQEIKVT